MIQLKIDGVRFEIDKKTKRYIRRKIGRLDRFLPKDSRNGLHAQVTLIQNTSQPKERFVCEARLAVRGNDLFVKEAAIPNMYAAIDLVEAKLQRQMRRYKTKKLNARQQARRRARNWRRFGRS